ncbi:MAG: hypothetical protein AAGF29_06255, partial [Pseudomonadota bacterium]
ALELKEHTKISWPILWPHVRAWKLARPQPLLRAIGDVDTVAEKLASGLRAAHGQPAQSRMAIETSEGSAQPFQPNVAGATAH